MPERQPQQLLHHPSGVIHEIRWREICPWLILVKALRATLLLRVLILAMLGVFVTQSGWTYVNQWFGPELPLSILVREQLPALEFANRPDNVLSTTQPEQWQSGTLVSGWYWLTKPFLELSNRQLSWQGSCGRLLCGVWGILVWALFGGAICRTTSIYLTRGETIGPVQALRESIAVWLSTVGSPLIALLAATALSVPLLLLGFLLRLDLFAVIAGVVWCFVLAWGFMLAVVLVGLMLGWPLMWACLSVERSDAFDGVSRCYAYVYQRPLHLGFFILVAAMLGLLGNEVVSFFSGVTLELTEWILSWGMGAERAAQLFVTDLDISSAPLATRAINAWKWGLESIAVSFPIACLWPMAVGIYLLLRRQVDATEMDEITLSDGSLQAGLPAAFSKTSTAQQPVSAPETGNGNGTDIGPDIGGPDIGNKIDEPNRE